MDAPAISSGLSNTSTRISYRPQGNGPPDENDWITNLAKRFDNSTWPMICRLLFEIPDHEIEKFKEGIIDDEEMYNLISKRFQEDTRILGANINRMSREIKTAVINCGVENLRGKQLADAIYNIIDNVDAKERRSFCRQHRLQPRQYDSLRDCPISRKLKCDMVKWWWENIAHRSPEALEDIQYRTDQFFLEHSDCENKKQVENYFVGCKNIQILRGTNIQQ